MREVKGKAVKGTIMPLDKGPVVFDAYAASHACVIQLYGFPAAWFLLEFDKNHG